MIRCVIIQIKTVMKSLQIPLKLNNENAVHFKIRDILWQFTANTENESK